MKKVNVHLDENTLGWLNEIQGKYPTSAVIRGVLERYFRYNLNTITPTVHTISVRIDGELEDMLSRWAKAQGRSMSACASDALREYAILDFRPLWLPDPYNDV